MFICASCSSPSIFLHRQWACEPGASAPGGDQPEGHGPGCGHLQRSGHRAAGPAGPVCHLLQETAAGEEAQWWVTTAGGTVFSTGVRQNILNLEKMFEN